MFQSPHPIDAGSTDKHPILPGQHNKEQIYRGFSRVCGEEARL